MLRKHGRRRRSHDVGHPWTILGPYPRRVASKPTTEIKRRTKERTSIPNLCLHSLSINVNRSCGKLHANSRLWLEVKFVTSETREHCKSRPKSERRCRMSLPAGEEFTFQDDTRTVARRNDSSVSTVVNTRLGARKRTICQRQNHQWGQPMNQKALILGDVHIDFVRCTLKR